jgi:hypothetical protein
VLELHVMFERIIGHILNLGLIGLVGFALMIAAMMYSVYVD